MHLQTQARKKRLGLPLILANDRFTQNRNRKLFAFGKRKTGEPSLRSQDSREENVFANAFIGMTANRRRRAPGEAALCASKTA